MRISESIRIMAPIEITYSAFEDLERWPTVLPDTLRVEVLYDDRYNQEFTMTVARPSGPETVRGVRYCRRPFELEIFHITPPPFVKRMSGRWTFSDTGDFTTVSADREFEICDDAKGPDGVFLDAEQFAVKLAENLRTNLALFRDAIEQYVAD
ncbi:SRPBCC family protein [Nocardia sp. NPDC055002]